MINGVKLFLLLPIALKRLSEVPQPRYYNSCRIQAIGNRGIFIVLAFYPSYHNLFSVFLCKRSIVPINLQVKTLELKRGQELLLHQLTVCRLFRRLLVQVESLCIPK